MIELAPAPRGGAVNLPDGFSDKDADLIKELGLTASAGVSNNKIFAKLGSDYKKPNATTIISKDNYKEIAYPLSVENLIYVGKATKRKLNHIGIFTIGDLANADVEILKKLLGVWGEYLHIFANGEDKTEVRPCDVYSVIKSVGNSTTTKRDMINRDDVAYIVYLLSESVGSRLKEYGLKGTTISIYLRNADLITTNRQQTLKFPTNSSAEIAKKAMQIFDGIKLEDIKLRSIGIQVTNLIKNDDAEIQFDLYNNINNIIKKEKLEKGVDKIRAKFGYNSIKKAIMFTDESLTELNDAKEENVIHPIGFRKTL